MSLLISGDLRLRKSWQPMDTDAAAYITAVETADGQALEEKTKVAIDNFVLGCKQDGIWTAIKASCILAGARTLAGALVPLVGTAPTNFNFVNGDYNRKTGLMGNGSSKYLDSNRTEAQDPQNSRHAAFYYDGIAHNDKYQIANSSETTLLWRGTNLTGKLCQSAFTYLNGAPLGGLQGATRSGPSVTTIYANKGVATFTPASIARSSQTINIFGIVGNYSNARISFYSLGESLNLALLDARVTALINAFAAAIP